MRAVVWRPTTRTGRAAVALALAFFASLGFLVLMIASGERGGDTFASNWWLGAPGLLAGMCGVAAFATALVAIVGQRDRSVLVVLSALIGALVTLFIAGEAAVPH